jgi:hypothetical protein
MRLLTKIALAEPKLESLSPSVRRAAFRRCSRVLQTLRERQAQGGRPPVRTHD